MVEYFLRFTAGGALCPPQVVQAAIARIPAPLWEALFPFQREGVMHVRFVICLLISDRYGLQRNGRCLIGDEMGLGKTLQGLAIACAYRAEWPLLVVCPSSVRYVWAEEVLKWMPDVPPHEINVVLNGKASVQSLVTVISYDLVIKLAGYYHASASVTC